ncbi:uncharacterized protein LOC133885589 [Phragmites australis]|uniref:uncharacterized protein LOC133885589 n=1 Tax=Phragmites australis TaxID=29695 RepID=UPI002D783F0E|nr:uncharacterized protein LOC133885589 [Phragmites australis]
MATARGLLLPCILSFLLAVSAFDSAPLSTLVAASANGSSRDDVPAQLSAYEMLEGFGFPRGILPVGVTAYKYRPSDGAFQVYFDGDCEFEVPGGYRLTYRRVISGNVEGGSIRNLGGVSVRMFLLNWGIDRVVMEDPGHLMFYVGPLSQAFPADSFEESPECRCRSRGDDGDGFDVAAM